MFRIEPSPDNSPWGTPVKTKELAAGIWLLNGENYAGAWLSAQRLAALEQQFPRFSSLTGSEWFEEDEDLAAVILAFPMDFTCEAVYHAREVARNAATGYYAFRAGTWEHVLERIKGTPAERRCKAFEITNKKKFVLRDMESLKDGSVLATLVRIGDKHEIRIVADMEFMHDRRVFTDEDVEGKTV